MSISLLLKMLALSFLFACGSSEDEDSVDSTSRSTFNPIGTSRNSLDTASIPITVGPRSGSFGFSLASATNFSILLTDCSTGWTTTATAANPSLDVYIDDNDCLAKLTQFEYDGKTYIPGTDFTTWQADDTAIFEKNDDNTDTMEVRVVSTLDNPVSGTEAISYYFYELENGGTTTINDSDVGDPHALAVTGQSAPAFTIFSVSYAGTSATGAGQFDFKLECDVNIAANVCDENAMADITYKLVEDTYASAPTLAEVKTIFGTAGTSITIPADVVAVAGEGTTNGGFNTVTLDGPDEMHNNPNMLLILRVDGASDADLDNDSFTYFNVDVQVLTYP